MANETVELVVDTLNGSTRYRCPDCGHWEYAGKAIKHSKRCDYPKLQSAEITAKAEAQAEADRLYRFAQSVKRTGMSHGNTDDLAECVRRGLISQSDAMNLDD